MNRYLVESSNCWVSLKCAKDQKLFALQESAKAAREYSKLYIVFANFITKVLWLAAGHCINQVGVDSRSY